MPMGSFNLKWFQLLFCIAFKTVGTARLATSSAGGPGQGHSHGHGQLVMIGLAMAILFMVMVEVAILMVTVIGDYYDGEDGMVACGVAHNGDRIETRKRDGHHCEGEQK